MVLLLFQSCKSRKLLHEGKISGNVRKVIKTVEDSQLEFNTMAAKARVQFKGQGINQAATLNLKIINDSIIWGSVAVMLGLEVGYFYLTKYEAVAIDRFNKRYYQYPMSAFPKLIGIPGINYLQLENLLCGNLLFDLSDFVDITRESPYLIFNGKEDGYYRKTYIQMEASELSGYALKDLKDTWNADLSYREKITHEDKTIPKIIEGKLFLPEENYFKLNYYKIYFNQSVNINTDIPNNYQKAN